VVAVSLSGGTASTHLTVTPVNTGHRDWQPLLLMTSLLLRPLEWFRSIVMSLFICLYVCLFVREDISGTMCAIFTKLFVHVACARACPCSPVVQSQWSDVQLLAS